MLLEANVGVRFDCVCGFPWSKVFGEYVVVWKTYCWLFFFGIVLDRLKLLEAYCMSIVIVYLF